MAVDYAPVAVSAANSLPVFDSISLLPDPPSPFSVDIAVGGSLEFSAVASDPDSGDTVTLQWLLDGTVVESGSPFTYSPLAGDAGLHFLQVVATDDSPYAAFVVEHWSLSVFFPDADGDGWNSNRDCNDSNDLVNPGMTEIIENGVDDDCNEATSDDPVDFDEDGYDVNKEPFDCDDTDPDVNPGQTEILYNEKDDDCDTSTPDGVVATLPATVRDFNASHPDFEGGISGLRTGLVEPTIESCGKPVLAEEMYGQGAITGPETFDQWYNDVEGVNLTTTIPIVLTETSLGSGIFTYGSSSLFPIDGELWGNEGRSHNIISHWSSTAHSPTKEGRRSASPEMMTSGYSSTINSPSI